MAFNAGNPWHGEVISADASGAGVVVLLYESGVVTAHTLAADERLNVTDVILISTAGGVYDLVFGSVAAGRHVVKGNAEVLGGVAHHFETPISGPLATNLRLIAAAGQVDLIVAGFITTG
jgi:hypothetical protein